MKPANIHPAHRNRAALGIVEPRHESRHRRLAAPARSDEGNSLARRDVQVETVQHRRPVVREGHVGERDVSAACRQVDSVWCIDDGRRLVEQLEDSLDPDPCQLADREDPGERSRRCHKLGNIGREREERSDAEPVGQGQPTTERKDRNLPERRDRLKHRLVPRLDAHSAQLRPIEARGDVRDALDLA